MDKLLKRLILSLIMSVGIFLVSCNGDESDTLLPDPDEQGGSHENDPNTRVGRYEGAVYDISPNRETDMSITLQLNSDGSGYYMESRREGCKQYFYFDNHEFSKGRLWGLYGEGQERLLGEYEGDKSGEFLFVLESTGFSCNSFLKRVSTTNDSKRYQDITTPDCAHNFEAGNVYGYWHHYAATDAYGSHRLWHLALNEDNTFLDKQGSILKDLRRGTYEVSGHTLRLYDADGKSYRPYNIVVRTSHMTLEGRKHQYHFDRIRKEQFDQYLW